AGRGGAAARRDAGGLAGRDARVSVRRLLILTLRLALPIYLATVVVGLVPTAVAMLGLNALAGDRPWRADLLAPGWMNLAVELLMEAAYSRSMQGLAPVVAALLLLAPLAVLAQVVAYSFLAGGILESLPGDDGRPPF